MILWKRAVTSRGKFAQYALKQEKLHKGWWPFSIQILRELEQGYTREDDSLLDRVYQSLAAGTNVFKITRRGRFTDFDTQLKAAVKTKFPQTVELTIHDMGVSNAITSLELYNTFRVDRTVRLVASDYFDQLTLVDVTHPPWFPIHWTVAFDSQKTPIQTTGLNATFGNWPYPWRFALSRLIQAWVKRNVAPRAQHLLDKNELEHIEQVSLFHPEAIQLTQKDSQFQLLRHNVFTPNPVPCHIVRAMNVLTPKHFTHQQTAEAISASTHNLAEGGWLILGRSIDEEDGRLRATVYQWCQGQLNPEWHYNEGYEWPDLVKKACAKQHDA